MNQDGNSSHMSAQAASPAQGSQQELDTVSHEPVASPSALQTPRKRQKRPEPSSTPRQRYTKKWDPVLVVTDAKSPLTKTKLLDILRSEEAWSSLKPAQQRELLQYLPPSPSSTLRELEKAIFESVADDEPLPNVAVMRLDASMAFKADVRQFQEDLTQGKLDIGWIEEGMRASARRRKGDFDEWKVRERENQWSMNATMTENQDTPVQNEDATTVQMKEDVS